MAMTVNQRVAKQKQLRKEAGWKKVAVWVPNEFAARAIKRFAQCLRNKAKS